MTGRKTLLQIREQLAAARAGTIPPAADSAGILESLDRLADELSRTVAGNNGTELSAKGKEDEQDVAIDRPKTGSK